MKSLSEIKTLANQFNINVDLLDALISWFGEDIVIQLLELSPKQIQNTARVNFLKISRSESILRLEKEGITAKPLDFIPEGIIITDGWNKIGSSISYLSGEIMPQGLGSQLSVHALSPEIDDTILDVAAAPGGKTCFIGERMQNSGLIIANELSHSRIPSLFNNLQRHGITNTILTQHNGNQLDFSFKFDKILLDAPCSGDGLIISNPARKTSKTTLNNYAMQRLQISLLSRSLSLLKPGGICIYSTCSLNPIENEEVILPFIDQFTIKKIEIPGSAGFTDIHKDFKFVKRLLPHTYHCDGFFIAKLKKH